MGWTSVTGPAPAQKCILLGAPHTSIWDFIVSYLYYRQYGRKPKCMVKKELFVWPLGPVIRGMGGIPTDRRSSAAMVRSVIHEMQKSEDFTLAIALEGTRKPVRKWKTGYHLIAKEAGVPVYICYFDWGRKEIGVGDELTLTDNARADTDRVQAWYAAKGVKGKHPENFITE